MGYIVVTRQTYPDSKVHGVYMGLHAGPKYRYDAILIKTQYTSYNVFVIKNKTSDDILPDFIESNDIMYVVITD